jgi:hypothetical protein
MPRMPRGAVLLVLLAVLCCALQLRRLRRAHHEAVRAPWPLGEGEHTDLRNRMRTIRAIDAASSCAA